MASTGISEFTFGFAFLFEQTQRYWANLQAAPVLPSLKQEVNDAWDARLPLQGTDFYYQFKLSDYLTRRNSKYIADGTYNSPYYRISLHRRNGSLQHRRLMSHAQNNPNTFYVIPEFNGESAFNSCFLERQIVDNSRLIPLAQCNPINDGEQHHITFQMGNPTWMQHSEAKQHDDSIPGREIESLYRASHDLWRPVNMGFAQNLFDSTAQAVRRRLAEEGEFDFSVLNLLNPPLDLGNRTRYLQRTAELLSVFYGLTLVIVGREQ